jgi:predicted nucleotidyltransferase
MVSGGRSSQPVDRPPLSFDLEIPMKTRTANEILSSVGLQAEDLLHREDLLASDRIAVYLSGSLVEGLGNRGSDIDVYVVGSVNPTQGSIQRYQNTITSIHHHEDRRVDFEYWTNDAVERLVERTRRLSTNESPEERTPLWGRLSELECEFIHRLRIGLPLRDAECVDRLQRRFDYAQICKYFAGCSVTSADDALEDLYGMLDDFDYEVLLLRSRDLLDHICDAYCHHLGNTNTKRKWRRKILVRLVSDDRGRALAAQLWRLQFPVEEALRSNARACRAHVEQCITTANEVIEWIQG